MKNTQVSTKRQSNKAFSIMKKLSSFVKEEMKGVALFKVTYISSDKKAKVVRARPLSKISTKDEQIYTSKDQAFIKLFSYIEPLIKLAAVSL